MYIIKDKDNQYLTRQGWTRKGVVPLELDDALPFTKGEAARNPLPDGQSYVRYPNLKWRHICPTSKQYKSG